MFRFIAMLLFTVVTAFAPAVADVASVGYASNASNLSTGTVSFARLPVGTTANSVAAGNDVRFNSVPSGQPSDTVDSSRVLVWVE